jgi:hypothetical protein
MAVDPNVDIDPAIEDAVPRDIRRRYRIPIGRPDRAIGRGNGKSGLSASPAPEPPFGASPVADRPTSACSRERRVSALVRAVNPTGPAFSDVRHRACRRLDVRVLDRSHLSAPFDDLRNVRRRSRIGLRAELEVSRREG